MVLPFVKKFDIRGKYGIDIKDTDAFYLGLAMVKAFPLKKILLGWDTRESSKNLAFNVINAIKGKGVDISYIDKCPMEFVTCASYSMDFDLSIEFTGSHSPWDWTGLLMHVKGGESVKDEMMQSLVDNYESVINEKYFFEDVDLSLYHNALDEVEEIYSNKLRELIPLNEIKDLNILIDMGDGSGFRTIDVFEKLLPQVSVKRINDRRIYNNESSHTADPSVDENMRDLINGIKEDKKYSIGFGLDSDADRTLSVDENGQILDGSMLGGIISQMLVNIFGETDAKFGYAVECGPSMYNHLISLKNTDDKFKDISIFPIPVGRSIIRDMLRKDELNFGVENVGHLYFKDFFKTDSPIFAIMLILLWLSRENINLSEVFNTFPDGQRHTNISIPGEKKMDERVDGMFDELKTKYPIMKKILIDGTRGEIYEQGKMTGWFCLRHSGYENELKDYFGSIIPEQYEDLKRVFGKYIYAQT